MVHSRQFETDNGESHAVGQKATVHNRQFETDNGESHVVGQKATVHNRQFETDNRGITCCRTEGEGAQQTIGE
jgi:hypothetical protein